MKTLVALTLVCAWSGQVTAAAPGVVLENRQVALRFDGRTGAWAGLIDKRSGDNLVVEPGSATPPRPLKLDPARIDRALAEKRAVNLACDWLYTSNPPPAHRASNFLRGMFTNGSWSPTPVPSRRGVGDDRLHNRTGDFWYRHDFVVSADWPAGDAALVVGAVDDFDVVWVNGSRIGSTGQETPNFWETPRLYRFAGRLLRPGQTNTVLIKVTNGAYDGGFAGPVALVLAADWPVASPDTAAVSPPALSRDGARPCVRFACRDGNWEYRWSYWLEPEEPAFSRRLTVLNLSATEQVFQTATYRSPLLQLGPDQAVVFPGSLPVGDIPLTSIAEGETMGPRSQEPLAVLWSHQRQRGLGTWFHSEEEYAPVSAKRSGSAAEVRHSQQVIVRLGPGESVALGQQFFWLGHEARGNVLRGVQRAYREVGLAPPSGGLPGLKGMVMYCGHPGGPPELNFLNYGGFNALRAYVPTLRRLQIDLLWLLPTWEHGDGRRWNLYSPFDHFQVDHLLGTADDLKALSRQCRTNGIRLMFDLVPHGPPDFTPLAKAHPEWAAHKPDGTLQYEWGQLAFDNHHPGWQDYMRQAAGWGAREFDAVGARVDCGAGGPLNWDRAAGSRPSLSSLAGGLGMNQAIREGYQHVQRSSVLLPEEYTGANIFYRVADLTYDAQFYFLQADLLERHAPPEEWTRTMQQFLEDQREALPPGALKMRWISNHDTVSWTFQKQRPARAYGLPRMRALLALCALIEGVPMLYQGDEDPAVYRQAGDSSVEFLSQVYALRKRIPALHEGAADYTSVGASGGVFACLRTAQAERAIALVSLNPDPIQAVLSLPAGLPGSWTDARSGERFSLKSGSKVQMTPWQVRVLFPTADQPSRP